MGLDMYLYKVKPLSQKDVEKLTGKNTKEFSTNLLTFEKEDVEGEDTKDMFADLMPYMTKINAISSYYDIDTIKFDNGIPSDATIGMRCHGAYKEDDITFGFFWKGGKKEVCFSEDKYVIDKEVEVYVCFYKEVKYWRKAYDIQNKIHDSYNGIIENCGYYAIEEEVLRELMPRRENFEGILYHEWY